MPSAVLKTDAFTDEERVQFSLALAQALSFQKNYGRTVESFNDTIEGFLCVLEDYAMADILRAFKIYLEQKDDMPSPANLAEIIKAHPNFYAETVCSCGKHKGHGNWTPKKRAQVYAWYRKMDMRHHSEWHEMMAYLHSYEQEHGIVTPNL